MKNVLPELKITIFTTEDCSKCKILKMLLATKNIEFRDLDAIANRETIKDLGFMSAPIIRVEIEWQDDIWFWEMDKFINYLDENGIWVPA